MNLFSEVDCFKNKIKLEITIDSVDFDTNSFSFQKFKKYNLLQNISDLSLSLKCEILDLNKPIKFEQNFNIIYLKMNPYSAFGHIQLHNLIFENCSKLSQLRYLNLKQLLVDELSIKKINDILGHLLQITQKLTYFNVNNNNLILNETRNKCYNSKLKLYKKEDIMVLDKDHLIKYLTSMSFIFLDLQFLKFRKSKNKIKIDGFFKLFGGWKMLTFSKNNFYSNIKSNNTKLM